MNEVFSCLRSEQVYGPLLLGWSILLCIHGEVQQAEKGSGEASVPTEAFDQAHRLGNIALKLGVFDFLLDLLNSEPFNGKSVSGS